MSVFGSLFGKKDDQKTAGQGTDPAAAQASPVPTQTADPVVMSLGGSPLPTPIPVTTPVPAPLPAPAPDMPPLPPADPASSAPLPPDLAGPTFDLGDLMDEPAVTIPAADMPPVFSDLTAPAPLPGMPPQNPGPTPLPSLSAAPLPTPHEPELHIGGMKIEDKSPSMGAFMENPALPHVASSEEPAPAVHALSPLSSSAHPGAGLTAMPSLAPEPAATLPLSASTPPPVSVPSDDAAEDEEEKKDESTSPAPAPLELEKPEVKPELPVPRPHELPDAASAFPKAVADEVEGLLEKNIEEEKLAITKEEEELDTKRKELTIQKTKLEDIKRTIEQEQEAIKKDEEDLDIRRDTLFARKARIEKVKGDLEG